MCLDSRVSFRRWSAQRHCTLCVVHAADYRFVPTYCLHYHCLSFCTTAKNDKLFFLSRFDTITRAHIDSREHTRRNRNGKQLRHFDGISATRVKQQNRICAVAQYLRTHNRLGRTGEIPFKINKLIANFISKVRRLSSHSISHDVTESDARFANVFTVYVDDPTPCRRDRPLFRIYYLFILLLSIPRFTFSSYCSAIARD